LGNKIFRSLREKYMNEHDESKEQLLVELVKLHERVAKLEGMTAKIKDVEKRLKDSEHHYRDLVEEADIAILIDDKDGKFRYYNKKVADLFGYTREEMREQSIESLVHPEDVDMVLRFHLERLHGEDVPHRYEFRGVKKDGSVLYLEVDVVVLKEGSDIVGTRSYLWDISERKTIEKELKEARDELERRVNERTAEFKKANDLLKQKIAEGEQIERALKESEARYKALFDRSLLCVFLHDFEGNFIDVNDATLKLLGYTKSEIQSLTIASLIGEKQLPKALQAIKEIKQHGFQKHLTEYKIVKRDGNIVWVEAEGTLLYQDGEPYAIHGIARDITERKQTEQLLKKSEEEKAIILHSMSERVIYHDKDLKILWANRAAAKSVGATPSQIIGRYCYDIWQNRDQPCESCPVLTTIEKNEPQEGEVITPDGRAWFIKSYPVRRVEDATVGVVQIALDTTVLKKAEEALQKSEMKYKTLTDNINVGIYRNTVGPKGKFIEVNPAIVKMFGYESKEEFMSINVADLYQNPEDRKKFNEKMLTYGYVRNEELQLKRRDDSLFAGSVSAVAVKDANGVVHYYDGIVEDVTERKKAEEELKESYETLRRILDGTVNALASTTEKRDPYTAGHQHRVTQLACAIAQKMNLSEEQMEAIRVAGIVHDIGKIYVAAEILSKPIRLRDIEMALVKAHCKAGYDILKTIEFPWPVADIVYQHHERLDGSGYPRGLKDEDIFLEAKIIAVADVVEAMSSHRPYRSALRIEEAMEEIIKNRGKLYDPNVVDICVQLFKEGFKFKWRQK